MRGALWGGGLLVSLLLAPGAQPVAAQECVVEVPEWAPRGSARTARPDITVTIVSSCGTAIDVDSVRMTVDKMPVMPTTEGSGAEVMVRYVPESALLEEADHTITVEARDVNGVEGSRTWTFRVPDTYLR